MSPIARTEDQALQAVGASDNASSTIPSSPQPSAPPPLATHVPLPPHAVRSHELGQMVAQHTLAECYQQGSGVKLDPHQAVFWFRQAARQGYTPSQLALAQHYRAGSGVRLNLVVAAAWCWVARRDPAWQWPAEELLASVEAGMTREQRQCAQALATGWAPGVLIPEVTPLPGPALG